MVDQCFHFVPKRFSITNSDMRLDLMFPNIKVRFKSKAKI